MLSGRTKECLAIWRSTLSLSFVFLVDCFGDGFVDTQSSGGVEELSGEG